jgi:hypothetical protein
MTIVEILGIVVVFVEEISYPAIQMFDFSMEENSKEVW